MTISGSTLIHAPSPLFSREGSLLVVVILWAWTHGQQRGPYQCGCHAERFPCFQHPLLSPFSFWACIETSFWVSELWKCATNKKSGIFQVLPQISRGKEKNTVSRGVSKCTTATFGCRQGAHVRHTALSHSKLREIGCVQKTVCCCFWIIAMLQVRGHRSQEQICWWLDSSTQPGRSQYPNVCYPCALLNRLAWRDGLYHPLSLKWFTAGKIINTPGLYSESQIPDKCCTEQCAISWDGGTCFFQQAMPSSLSVGRWIHLWRYQHAWPGESSEKN